MLLKKLNLTQQRQISINKPKDTTTKCFNCYVSGLAARCPATSSEQIFTTWIPVLMAKTFQTILTQANNAFREFDICKAQKKFLHSK